MSTMDKPLENNRDIKFRAWDKVTEEMSEPFSLGEAVEDEVYHPNHFDNTYMQFTGLVDKNSNEIYEGDIVEITDGNNNIRIVTIEYSDDRAMFTQKSIKPDHSTSAIPNIANKFFEVIGNVYEKPELLVEDVVNDLVATDKEPK